MVPQHFIEDVKERAKSLKKHIVYPDATDERAIEAARIVTDEGTASISLVGDEVEIRAKAESIGVNLQGIRIVDPSKSSQLSDFANIFYNLRKHKGVTIEEAQETMRHPLYFSSMMLREGMADGSVAGSLSTTGEVMRAAILCIGLKEGINTVSSFFVMVMPENIYLFADSAVLPLPTLEQLVDIAISTSDNFKALMQEDAATAMLSFSTRGSAEHELVDKVAEATKLCNERRPDLNIDGEMQFDTAIVPKVGEKKAPGSKVAGKANVLIFPDLQSGNIGYKITQRLAGAEAIGPIVQGLAKPAYDLSRGCSVNDIVTTTAFNAVMGAA
jgi:phosphate acetyltransferase